MFVSIALLTCGVVLHVEEAHGVSAEERRTLEAELSGVLERASQAPVRGAAGVECPADASCLDAIRASTGERDVVVVRIIAIPTRVRVVAERAERSWQVDLARDPAAWPEALAPAGAALFPPPPGAPRATPATLVLEPPPVLEPEPNLLPWALIGAGTLAAGAGVVLGARNTSARNEGSTSMDPMRVEALRDEAFATGLAANILFGVAVAGIAGGVVWLAGE